MRFCKKLLLMKKKLIMLMFYACAFVVFRRIRDSLLPSNELGDGKCRAILQTPQFVRETISDQCVDCEPITCAQLLAQNVTADYIARAVRLTKSHTYKRLPDAAFVQMAHDCVSFKRQGGYHMTPIDDEEASFPIAYNIIMHHNVQQVELLLRAIYRPQNTYCIHVDAKASADIHAAIQAIVACFPNVFIASRLEHIVYAGFSRLQADINCMWDHLRQNGSDWRYLINVAGEAFPLRTNAEIVRILKIYNGANDVEGIYGKRIIRSRFEVEYMEITDGTGRRVLRATGKTNPPVPHAIDIVRGSAYVTLSRAFVEWALNDDKARDLLTWAKHTYSPDEFYWSTLHHNYRNPKLKPPGGYSGIPDGKPWLSVFAAWRGMHKCHGTFVRDVCVFGVGDLSSLVQRKELTLNKFYIDQQPLALQCMQAWIKHNTICPPALDYAYYRSLPFVIT